MNCRDLVIGRLKNCLGYNIIFLFHAKIRYIEREVEKTRIMKLLREPENFVYAVKQESLYPDEEKFNCYFMLSENETLRLVIAVNDSLKKLFVITIVKSMRNWKGLVEKYEKQGIKR